VDVEFEPLDPDGFDTFVFPDFEFRVPRGIDRYRHRLCQQFPDERHGIDRYIRLLASVNRLTTAGGSVRRMIAAVPSLLRLLWWSRTTFSRLLDNCTHDPRLRAVLAGQQGEYAMPSSRVAALMPVALASHYLEGAHFPRGGGQIISDRLAESIERNGGSILLQALVHRIVVEDGRVRAVQFESKHVGRQCVETSAVVSNADLKKTVLDLVGGEHFRATTIRRIQAFEMAPALGVVYLGIRRDLRAENHPRTNYWVYPDYDIDGLYECVARGEFPAKPFVYISCASLKDPTNPAIAPPDMTNLQLVSLAPASPSAWGVTGDQVADGSYRQDEVYRRKKEAFADRLLRAAERVLPGIRGQVDYQEVATPLTETRYTLATGGTSYGIAATPSQFLFGRPGSRTDVKGLYLCGASCRMGHGIAGVMMSGVDAANQLLPRNLFAELFA
jgi:phytoene dehydrogenase-like protein